MRRREADVRGSVGPLSASLASSPVRQTRTCMSCMISCASCLASSNSFIQPSESVRKPLGILARCEEEVEVSQRTRTEAH
jgi:hypothetical protein